MTVFHCRIKPFSTVLATLDLKRNGAVCGHLDRVEMREIKGALHCDDGDRVEGRTALVDHDDGRLESLQWEGAVHPAARDQQSTTESRAGFGLDGRTCV